MFSRFCISHLGKRSCCNLVTIQVNSEFPICKMTVRKWYPGLCSKNIDMILPYLILIGLLKKPYMWLLFKYFSYSVSICVHLCQVKAYLAIVTALPEPSRHLDSYTLIFPFVILIRGLTLLCVGARVEIKLGMVNSL